MSRETRFTGDLLAGVEMNVYRAQAGEWHGHVSLPRGWRDYFAGLRMRAASISAEGIAYARGCEDRPGGASAYAVRATFSFSHYWMDVGYCSTEDEARARCAEVIGWVYGQRLLEDIGPQQIPASVRPGRRELRFA